MANKATLTNSDILADEGVRLDFAVVTDARIALDFNKRADEYAVAQHTVVKVSRLIYDHIVATGHVANPGLFTLHRFSSYIKHN